MRIAPFIAILLASCHIETIGLPRVSQSLAASKENGVFCYSLKPNKAVINIAKTQTDTIEEAWVEYAWKYESHNLFFRKVVKDTSQRLVVRFSGLPVYKEAYWDIWLTQGKDKKPFTWWQGTATVRVNKVNLNSPVYVVEHPFQSTEVTLLDSFRLNR